MSQDSDRPDAQIERIVDGFLKELRNGASSDPSEVAARHPELAPQLEEQLRLAATIGKVFQAKLAINNGTPLLSTMADVLRIDCPHCGKKIQLIDTRAEVQCGTCGSSFTPPDNATQVRHTVSSPQFTERFELIRELGQGSFGAVYQAVDTTLKREVAVKVPRLGTFNSATEEQRFIREAQSAARLSHPGIVPVHDIGTAESLFIVSEYIPGITLADLITGSKVSFRESAVLIASLSDALDYAHSEGVIHRDVKPANVLLDLKNRPHLTDFGMARLAEPEFTMTIDGEILGTPAFMSPEQAAAEHHRVDRRSDVYSLGVTLYRMLSGELPFRGSQRMLLHQVMNEEPRAPRKINDAIPCDLETIALTAMQKEPAKRYQSAKELADDLRRWLAGDPIHARPPSAFEVCWKWCRKRPMVSALIALSTVLTLLITFGAILAAVRESRLRSIAQDTSIANQQLLTTSFIQTGLGVNENAPGNGLQYFVEALAVQETAGQQGVDASRLRISRLTNSLPRLIHLQDFEHRIDAIRFDESNQRIYVASGTTVTAVSATDQRTEFRLKCGVRMSRIEFTPDGSRLVVKPHPRLNDAVADADASESTAKPPLQLWNPETHTQIANLQHDDFILNFCISADGTSIATTGRDGIKIWSTQTGELRRDLPLENLYSTKMQFTPDGTRLIAHVKVPLDLDASKIIVFKTSDWTQTQFEHGSNVTDLQATDSQLWTASINGPVRQWNLPDGKPAAGDFPHTSPVRNIRLIDDDHVLTYTKQGDSTFWNTLTQSPVYRPTHHAGINLLLAPAVARNSSFFVAGSANGVDVIWTKSGQRACPALPLATRPTALEIGADDRQVIVGGMDGVVRIWDLAGTTRVAKLLLKEKKAIIQPPVFSNPGGQLAVPVGDRVIVWDPEAQSSREFKMNSTVMSCTFGPSGKTLATADKDGQLRLEDITSGRVIAEWASPQKTVVKLLFSPTDSDILIAGHLNGAVVIWSISQQTALANYQHKDTIRSATIDRSNNVLATGSNDKTVRFWDLNQMQPGRQPLLHSAYVSSLHFSKDGKQLLTTTSPWTLLWNLENGKVMNRTRKPVSVANAIFADTNNTYLANNNDGVLCEWPADDSGALVGAFENHAVSSVVKSPLLDMVLTCGESSTNRSTMVQLWDRQTKLPAMSPFLHAGRVRAAVSPDGKSIVTSSTTGSIWQWRIGTTDLSITALRQLYAILSGHQYRDGVFRTLDAAAQQDVYQQFAKDFPEQVQATAKEIREWNERCQRLDVSTMSTN